MEEKSPQDEFISIVSHELRTPLTSIRGFSQTLLASWDKIGESDKKKFIGIIEEQSNRLIHLVENVLSVSNMQKNNAVLRFLNINSIIKRLSPIFINQYKNKNIILDLQNNIPETMIDEDKFQQILTNLVDNAAKYSDDGKDIKITTKLDNNTIILSVSDEGVGIKSEDFSKVFQKFSRLENHLTSKTQGNGLGLYITKQLVEQMNGKITFESTQELGTTFYVNFPVYNEEDVIKCSQQS